jgi:hypothetical protein
MSFQKPGAAPGNLHLSFFSKCLDDLVDPSMVQANPKLLELIGNTPAAPKQVFVFSSQEPIFLSTLVPPFFQVSAACMTIYPL